MPKNIANPKLTLFYSALIGNQQKNSSGNFNKLFYSAIIHYFSKEAKYGTSARKFRRPYYIDRTEPNYY